MALRKARLRATSSLALALAAAQLPRGGRRCRNYKQHNFEGDMCSDLGVSQQMRGREPQNSFLRTLDQTSPQIESGFPVRVSSCAHFYLPVHSTH